MKIDISHKDISSELCQNCGACCRVTLGIKATSTRYRKFLRAVGCNVFPAADGDSDCCGQRHDITLDMGYCKHLDQSVQNGTIVYRCRIYGTEDYPQLCEDFDCVSWAKHDDSYTGENKTLAEAQMALDRLREWNTESSSTAAT